MTNLLEPSKIKGCGKVIDGLKCGCIEYKDIHERTLFLGYVPLIDALKKAEGLGWKIIYKTERVGRFGQSFYCIYLLCPDCAKKRVGSNYKE